MSFSVSIDLLLVNDLITETSVNSSAGDSSFQYSFLGQITE